MLYGELITLAKSLGAVVEENAPMSKYTSFKTGGNADLLIIPASVDSLAQIVKKCKESNIKPFVMGNGSNLLVTDNGYKGVIIKIGSNLSSMKLLDENTIECESGVMMKSLCNFALDNSLTGLEFAFGIPGNLGGAVYMNAGAYGGEMKDVLYSCTHVDNDGNIGTLTKDQLDLGYRRSAYTDNDYTIISATLKLQKGDKTEIKEAMNDKLRRRKEKQPLEFPSAGSTFKRPEGYFAGAIIEDCNLKGYTIGGAQVSEKHAGFVINRGGATSADILNLIKHIQDTVFEKHGVKLETEVKIIGE